MTGQRWVDAKAPATVEAVQAVVRLIGGPQAEAPERLIRLYQQYNGGGPEYDDPMAGPSILHGITPITPVIRYGPPPARREYEESVEQEYWNQVEEWPWLSGYLPFGYDAGGHPFLLSLRPESLHQVFVFLQDDRELHPEAGGLRLVDDDFGEFLDWVLPPES